MIGALVLGDFAVQAHWLVPEVLAYMAFVAIANFAQPSYELGYAFKLLRLMLLLFVGALDWIGLVLVCFVLSAILSWLIALSLRKWGWIGEDDLTLDL